ncbi:tetratricopeptide repeat protein [Polaromonas sp.]|uniref:O-linked N-acetylglucosamine transferase, SPINDLY family protein n=1 Tax=Polaromonas sp. TaxID=1869339 RepID=UPI003CA108E9
MTSSEAPDAPAELPTFHDQMSRGIAAHEAGDLVGALTAFESAVALEPGNTNAVSACATLLSALARPHAAFKLLQQVEPGLLGEVGGATNLAIAAMDSGHWQQAKNYIACALALDSDDIRALNHAGQMAAREGRWEEAIDHATRCQRRAAGYETAWTQLADYLMGARRYAQALAHIQEALKRFPESPQLTMRQSVALALQGEFDAADTCLAALGPEANAALLGFWLQGAVPEPGRTPAALPCARALFCRHAFGAMDDCDWRDQDRLIEVLHAEIDRGSKTAGGARIDLRPVMYNGLVLPWGESELMQASELIWSAMAASQRKPLPPFSSKRTLRPNDGRIHVGLAVPSLRDAATTESLAAQLALHDDSRFAFHIYSATPEPQAVWSAPLLPHSVIEMAHFSDEETVQRTRLDQLDIWVDMTLGSPGWRPYVAHRRVAPVQIQQTPWQSRSPASPFDYALSDNFVHPGIDAHAHEGALVRLPHTCWLAPVAQASPPPAFTRTDAGLPAEALVLCAWVPALRIDPQSFSLWMQLLNALPEAVLWLPPFTLAAQANLTREAQQAGILAYRLIFATPDTRQNTLARMPLADLFLDPLRFNASQSLADALRAGLPAITCAGKNKASRLGGSIIRAAGSPDCVFENEEAYLEAAIGLGRDHHRLAGLRARLLNASATAPLFQSKARVKELEAAWAFMVQRARAGLSPTTFDVPGHLPQSLPY